MNLVKSKPLVADHGEVFTPEWMVEAMLDLVKEETERIDSRFLEPACGSGNFIVQILKRKLTAVELKFGKSEFERQHYALYGLMCIYGIELLADNIAEWGYLGKGKFQRRDFRFDVLTGSSAFSAEGSLFADLGKHEIFAPIKTHLPMTVRELASCCN
jgi:type I restriction-modification system DNA methylase subunit